MQVPITTIGKLQIVELDYGNNCISSYTITPSFIEVNSRNEVTLGKFYVDTLNGLLYIFGTNNTNVTFTYNYSYLKKEVITDNEVYKIPRQNELKALKGNEYSINTSEQYPSNSNKFITSKSPVPKRISADWDVKIYGNETYLVSPNRETIFVGTDSNEYIKFFEVLSLGDNSLPIALDSVHMARFENNTIVSINSITDTNGWVEQNDTPSYYERVALKIKPYSEFVAQSISSIRCTVSYHKMEGLGEISTPNGIEYLANTIYKNNYREFNTVKVDCLFGFKINSGANEIAYFKPNEIGIKGNDGISDGFEEDEVEDEENEIETIDNEDDLNSNMTKSSANDNIFGEAEEDDNFFDINEDEDLDDEENDILEENDDSSEFDGITSVEDDFDPFEFDNDEDYYETDFDFMEDFETKMLEYHHDENQMFLDPSKITAIVQKDFSLAKDGTEPDFSGLVIMQKDDFYDRNQNKSTDLDIRNQCDVEKWGYNDHPIDVKKIRKEMEDKAKADIERITKEILK